ncbi:MAG: hypothetical protein FWD61_04000 [Phycisphaerales bacterium]|nr:hypothetical protein [Phycisphaerales bacterium]
MGLLLALRGSRVVWCALAIAACVSLSSCSPCGFIAEAVEKVAGKSVVAEYHGLANKSVAIVVFMAPGIIDEFPSAREDVSGFLATQMRQKMPDVRLLDYREVIRWQDDTIHWSSMTEKNIGRRFGVDRVLYIELLVYASRLEAGYGDLQGRLKANCKIFETDTPDNAPAWTAVMDITWPKARPLDPNQMSEVAVRKRTLEMFATNVTDKLHDHKEFETRVSERND